MLIDHIVDYCDKTYREYLCNDYNHQTYCGGNCKECLDEVHWLRQGGIEIMIVSFCYISTLADTHISIARKCCMPWRK